MTDLEKCIQKLEVYKLMNFIAKHKSTQQRAKLFNHLRTDPLYKCYFCEGFNYNCVGYKTNGK